MDKIESEQHSNLRDLNRKFDDIEKKYERERAKKGMVQHYVDDFTNNIYLHIYDYIRLFLIFPN